MVLPFVPVTPARTSFSAGSPASRADAQRAPRIRHAGPGNGDPFGRSRLSGQDGHSTRGDGLRHVEVSVGLFTAQRHEEIAGADPPGVLRHPTNFRVHGRSIDLGWTEERDELH